MIKKQTKLWTTKDKRKIRICDMDDQHLENTINMIERTASKMTDEALNAGYRLLCILQGEMAIESVEDEIIALEMYGIEPDKICPLYENLCLEKERRMK